MTKQIHTTAIIHPQARLASGVSIGPYCVIGEHVVLEENVTLVSHVSVEGRTTIGAETKIFPFASIGHPCQDLKYAGEPSTLHIGKRNTIREYVTIHPGTQGGGMKTRVGDDCLLMIGAHVAHDCDVGSRVILANQATLGGHVCVDDDVIIGGLCAIHQFVRIGAQAIVGGASGVEADVIPYGSVWGNRARLRGLNWEGLRRRGYSKEALHTFKRLYKTIFSPTGTLQDRLAQATPEAPIEQESARILDFMRSDSIRGICLPELSETMPSA